MITFKRVTKKYAPHHHALVGLNFHIPKGEMIFIQGHAGSGKSTLINLISGIEPVCGGEIIVDGLKIHQLPTRQIPLYRRRLGIIFQNPMLLNSRSVYENVAIPLILKGLHKQVILKRVNLTLDSVGLLHKATFLPNRLSGTEQQRLNIARAIVHEPTILLADEPTANLDPELSTNIMNLFSHLNKKGMTILIATHNRSLLQTMLPHQTCRYIDLKQGQITCIR